MESLIFCFQNLKEECLFDLVAKLKRLCKNFVNSKKEKRKKKSVFISLYDYRVIFAATHFIGTKVKF